MNLEEYKIYLPKYLSAESEKELFKGLEDFPNNMDGRLYTNYLKESEIIYQGDGLRNLLYIDLPETNITKEVLGMVISNTCDTHVENIRNFSSRIIYSPIIELKKYLNILKEKIGKTDEQIESHLDSIKRQRITQIFYLPLIQDVLEDSIVFFDRVLNISNNYINRTKLSENRIFTLSDYGNYLFLYKLSLHFTRVQDKVERKSNQ